MSTEQVTVQEIAAFKKVFGTEGNRTQAQRFVWEVLKDRLRLEKPCFEAQIEYAAITDADGQNKVVPVKQAYDPIAAAETDGMRRAMIFIKERVEAKSQDDSE